MAVHEVFCFLFIFFFFPFIHSSCPISKCASNGPIIRFPFQGSDKRCCSYPGFDLWCNVRSDTILKLRNSGEFFVRDIDYLEQYIHLYDPGNCLPKRLLELNLSDTPFMVSYYRNYTFLSCPFQLVRSRFTIINCLSNSTTSVLATSSISLAREMSNSCQIISTLPIPISWPLEYNQDGFSSELSNDLRLNWNEPDCRDCEMNGGFCGFKSNISKELGCFNTSQTGNPRQLADGAHIFRIIALSFTIPAVATTIGIAIFVCFVDRRRNMQRAAAVRAIAPQPTVVMTGLDESTIQSYTKILIGESKRLPGPNDTTCPICLSEYCAKDAIRVIPECKHCFHADCIDEWLRMHNTCPICRNSPSPARVT